MKLLVKYALALTKVRLKEFSRASGTTSNIALSLTSGSDYSCTWNFGDGTVTENTDEAELIALSFTKTHLYLSAGSYTITVTCSNNVSSQVATTVARIQQTITGLRMTSEGADKGDDFYIRWEVSAGTEITFALTFDGVPITTHTEYETKKWQSNLQAGRPVSAIPLTLTASNLISCRPPRVRHPPDLDCVQPDQLGVPERHLQDLDRHCQPDLHLADAECQQVCY
ncbi:hypothetical protein EGW08_003750 [Elysia chlorotica]|uniref:PKD domain-containing protein n=1 Tax=Elysia chlorotica TaxID=188477 RepID=A0A433U3U2_ELYCH|nr:hypothetical protein EGW08_003750 [Elysia chlorotica]